MGQEKACFRKVSAKTSAAKVAIPQTKINAAIV
jgi:hypothetical protein